MKPFFLLFLSLFLMNTNTMAQENTESDIPYHEIPDYPETFTAETAVARMVDGLGYRYYWATESLRPEDLAYKPSEDSRPVEETLDHVLGLTNTLLNAVKKQPNIRGDRPEMTFEEKRKKTLENIKMASDILRSSEAGSLDEMKIIFQRGDQSSEYPFWNMLNGPLADAIYHTGQIVSHRRASGNPLNPKVSVFRGKNRG